MSMTPEEIRRLDEVEKRALAAVPGLHSATAHDIFAAHARNDILWLVDKLKISPKPKRVSKKRTDTEKSS